MKIRFQLSKKRSLIISHQEKIQDTWDFKVVLSWYAKWTKPCFYPRNLLDFLLVGLTWMAVSWLNLSWQLWDVQTVPHSGLWDYAKQSNFLDLMDQETCMATRIRVPDFYFVTQKAAMVIVLCSISFHLTKIFFWSCVILERQLERPWLNSWAIYSTSSMLPVGFFGVF